MIIYFVSSLLSYFLLYQQQSYCEIKIFSLKCHKENAVDTLPSPIGDFEGSFSDSGSIPRVLMSNKHLIWKLRLPPPKDVYWLIVHKKFRRRPGHLRNVLCTFNCAQRKEGRGLLHLQSRITSYLGLPIICMWQKITLRCP